ncbi:unnamed protein product, partial [Musa acuminata subsp. malaccensis]
MQVILVPNRFGAFISVSFLSAVRVRRSRQGFRRCRE